MELFYIIAVMLLIVVLFFVLKPKKSNDILINFDIDSFVNAVGGYNNIKSSSATISKVTLEIDNYEIIDVEALKLLGASGVVVSGNKVSIILGQISKDIHLALEHKLNRE